VRLLAKVTIPMEKGGKESNREALPRAMKTAMERLKPEAAYVFEEDGKRECLFVFDLDLPSMLKPIFQNLDASVQVTPVMNASEFERGLGDAGNQRAMQRLGDADSKRPLAEESELLTDIRPVVAGTPGPTPMRGDWLSPSPLPEVELEQKP